MSVGLKRHTHGSGFVAPALLDKVIAAIQAKVKVKRGVDVPYAAGYSEDGKTVYVDRDVPKVFHLHGKACDVTRYLILHEMVEKALMDALGLPYEYAHGLATLCEERAVQGDGHDLDGYNAEWDKVIRKVATRGTYPNVPPDLDTEPYADEHDEKAEGEMGLMGKSPSTDPYDFPAPAGGKAPYTGRRYGV